MNNKTSKFICNSCNKIFKNKFTLLRHKSNIHNKTKADTFICNECSKVFHRKYCLARHIRTHMIEESRESYECAVCYRRFTSKSSLLHHNYKQHPSTLKNECHIEYYVRELDNAKGYVQKKICHHCCMTFSSKYNLELHIQAHHLTESNKKPTRKCLNCDESFENKNLIIAHYERVHGIQLEFEYLRFPSITELQKWINPCYFKEGAWKTTIDFVTRYRCHRSGNYTDQCIKNKSKRKRSMKLFGTKKLQGFCPAEITVRENFNDKSCIITHQKVHVGHNIHDEKTELQFKCLNKPKKQGTDRKLIENVLEDAVLQNIYQVQDESMDDKHRFDLINKNDIHNIRVSHRVTNGYAVENYPVHVDSFILENKQSVLFYKPQGEKDTVYQVFLDDDIVLIYQDSFQKECLLKYGSKFVSFDVTRRTNPHDCLLHTMLVLDEDDEGIPVAYYICNRSDQSAINVFIQCIRNHAGAVVARTVMSDLDEVYHEAYRNIMGQPRFSLFCTKHVKKAWNQKLIELITVTGQPAKSKKKYQKLRTDDWQLDNVEIVKSQYGNSYIDDLEAEEIKTNNLNIVKMKIDSPLNIISAKERQCLINDVRAKLTALATELDHFSFQCKLTSFLDITDRNAKPFIDYFRRRYANKAQYWAACYRLHAGANTNIHMETYHRVLNYTIGRAKTLQTLAAGLDCIKNYELHRRNENKILRPTLSKKLEDLRNSHQEADNYIKNQSIIIEVVDNNNWRIGSFSNTSDNIIEMYLIEKLEEKECKFYKEPCKFQCTYCESCFHEYKCTCYNSAINSNMCKHIHALLLCEPNQERIETETLTECIELPLISVDESSRSSNCCEESSELNLNDNFSCEWAKEQLMNTMEELLKRITPQDEETFNYFYEKYLRPLPSMYEAIKLKSSPSLEQTSESKKLVCDKISE